MQQLAQASFPVLESIGLPHCNITDRLFEHFMEINAPKLTAIDFSENRLRNESPLTIATSSKFATIKFLDLFANEIRQTGGLALASSANLSSIEFLNILDNPIGGRAAAAVLRRFQDDVRV